MSSQSLFKEFTEFEPSKIRYAAPRNNPKGGRNVRIKDETDKTLALSTPLMLTWGFDKKIDDKGNESYLVSIQFPREEDATEEQAMFLEKMKELERKVIEDTVENSVDWLDDPDMDVKSAKKLMYPLIKYPKNKETKAFDYSRPPSMKVKIPCYDEKFNVNLFDTDRNPIFTTGTFEPKNPDDCFVDLVPKLSRMSMIIQCGGIWFTGGKFSVTFRLQQGIVSRPVNFNTVKTCLLPALSTDEKTYLKNEETKQRQQAESELAAEVDQYNDTVEEVDNTQVEDTDNEDNDNEDNEVPEEEPEEEPPKPKTRGRKKAKVTKK